jgi:hypothetical protein
VTRNADGTLATHSAAVRGDRLQDERRPRQLQLHAALADPTIGPWAGAERQYTLGYSKGNTGGSNEAVTAGNNARALSDFDYDDGYNNYDVRHTFNLSALIQLPRHRRAEGRLVDWRHR